jgi:carbonic anhydrase
MKNLFDNNKAWADKIEKEDPEFFATLSKQQNPEYLWIGCADSRVPANEIVGLLPGELFVHRNVANLVMHTDFNCLSVIQYAVEVLKVKHIIVVGHYGCGGVHAALDNKGFGLVDNWLQQVKDVIYRYNDDLTQYNRKQQGDMLCELNVLEQVQNVCRTSILQEAWKRDQNLQVHGWVYSLENGLITDLDTKVSSIEGMQAAKQKGLDFIRSNQSTS